MLENDLKKLGQISPPSRFVEAARARLVSRMQESNEAWFLLWIKKMGLARPSLFFVESARRRLLLRISSDLLRPFYFFGWLKKCLASTLVMTVLALATLFFVNGPEIVTAAQDSTLTVRTGEVLVQRSGETTWQTIRSKAAIQVGDTLQLNPGAYASITFFDDTELRLADRATLVVNQIDPAARRGMGLIALSLLAGRGWLQALNVPGNHQSVTLRTPDSLIGLDRGVFDVLVDSRDPSTVRVFKHSATVSALNETSGLATSLLRVTADHETRLNSTVAELPSLAYTESWVMDNTAQDQLHLLSIERRELDFRKKSAGLLPGQFLYPLKQAKERLSELLAFDEGRHNDLQLQIANQRLSEAIVLLGNNDYAKAQESLLAYQGIARQIAQDAKHDLGLKAQITRELIVRNNKSLVAALPHSPIHFVKSALDETEELITDNPLDREKVRLQNMVDSLGQVNDLVAAGNAEAAKEILVAYQTMESRILTEANKMGTPEERTTVLRDVLDIRRDALASIDGLSKKIMEQPDADHRLVAMLQSADLAAEREVNKVNALMAPLLPAPILPIVSTTDRKVAEFAQKIGIYRTWQGQRNQVNVMLDRLGRDGKNIEFLAKLRTAIESPRARDLINSKILELKAKARDNKNKAVQRRIERAKRGRN